MSTRTANRDSSELVYTIGKYVILGLMLAGVLLPILYVFLVAFRTPDELFTQETYWIPRNPTLESWRITLFEELPRPLWNSFLISSGSALLALFITIPGAYTFGRKEFPGKNILFYMILFALLFPYILLVIPITVTWTDLGLYNTLPGLWLAHQVFVTPFALWILRDFFEKLPKNLEEAAQVYGCTQFTAFLRVILPISLPAVIAVGFLAFVAAWHDFLFSAMLTTSEGPWPSVVVLYKAARGTERTFWGLVMSMTVVTGVPPAIFYLVARRYLSDALAVNS